MIKFIYTTLESLGFQHPLHPVVVHLPMGMTMGLFLFGLAAYFLKKPEFERTAHYCAVLAFLGAFPTILLGYMDWQYRYNGEWLFPIEIKLIFGTIFVILLAIAIKVGVKQKSMTTLRMVVYLLCMMTATVLGFFGGKLIFG